MAKRKHRPNLKPSEQSSKSNPWSLPGPAAHRVETGQSGLDPLGARQEAAFAQGLFIRNLFTGRLRTHRLSLLLLMGLIGACLLIPLIFSAIEWFAQAPLSMPILITILTTIVSVFFFWNIAVNLSTRRSHHDNS